jgi:hypothetical protein
MSESLVSLSYHLRNKDENILNCNFVIREGNRLRAFGNRELRRIIVWKR